MKLRGSMTKAQITKVWLEKKEEISIDRSAINIEALRKRLVAEAKANPEELAMRISHLPKKEQTLVLNLLREEVRQGVAQLTDIFTPFANNVYKGTHMEVRGFRHNGRFTTRHI